MFRFIVLSLGTLVRLLRTRPSLLIENLALRQQLAVVKRRHPKSRIGLLDKLFWVGVRRVWSGWKQSLIVVPPETVVLSFGLLEAVSKPDGIVIRAMPLRQSSLGGSVGKRGESGRLSR
jgi:hypothetical protein